MTRGTIYFSILPSGAALIEACGVIHHSAGAAGPVPAAVGLTAAVVVTILAVTAGFLIHDIGAPGALLTLVVQTVCAVTSR
jgi:hypothetical protein